MKIILTANNLPLHNAWQEFCQFDFVEIYNGSILDKPTDAIVNFVDSFGFMGSDCVSFFGWEIEGKLQNVIREEFDNELLVGQSVLMTTGKKSIPYMISSPVRRTSNIVPVDTVNPYLAAKSAILCAIRANKILDQYKGDPNARGIECISFPSNDLFGYRLYAHQVCQAIKETLIEGASFPHSCYDADHRHEQLMQPGVTNV